jgi:hypothetical protein
MVYAPLPVELPDRGRYAHGAELVPDETAAPAPADVGAVVTAALCGHWEHEGPCRWPNNHSTVASGDSWTYLVLFVAPPFEERELRERIEEALATDNRWRVVRSGPRDIAPEEHELADRLAATPRRS